jgi:hypothetical protein
MTYQIKPIRTEADCQAALKVAEAFFDARCLSHVPQAFQRLMLAHLRPLCAAAADTKTGQENPDAP